MRPNNLLTTLLYALLVALIFIAVYKGCQMQRYQQTKAEQDAQLREAQQATGYYDQDSSEYGSSYVGEADTLNSLAPTQADRQSANRDGIEDEDAGTAGTGTTTGAAQRPARNANTNTRPGTTTNTNSRPAGATTTTKGATTETADAPATPTRNVPRVNRDTRYSVVAGTFSKMDGARRRLEEVIKMGYTNAEIGKINNGAHAVVVVKRTNDLNEAIRLVDRLEEKGMDARVLRRDQ